MNKEKTVLAGVWALIAAGNAALAVRHGRASDKVNAALCGISAGCAAVCAGLNFAAALPGTAEERRYARKVGRELRYLREMRGWTRAELAKKSGIDGKLIGRAERGAYLEKVDDRAALYLLVAVLGDQARERAKRDENKK